jgi:hypothetical protein
MLQRHIEQTIAHKDSVRKHICRFIELLEGRAEAHDASKLIGSECDGFAEILTVLESHPYGSPEYMESLKSNDCIEQHYKSNRHHPEHHQGGVGDMTLLDVVEMYFDWVAACERRPDGDIAKSIPFNEKRFGACSLWSILANEAAFKVPGK